MKLKIGTFNIQHGRDHARYLVDGEERIALLGVADVIRAHGIEVCGLNEVRNQSGGEGLCDQARVIADALGYHSYFARAIDIPKGEYGNAIVSKYPIDSVRTVAIPSPAPDQRRGPYHYESRVLLIAELMIEGKVLTVLSCHFGLNDEEISLAIDTIRAALREVQGAVVLMGDFNLTPDTAHYARLAALLKDTAKNPALPLTFPSEAPERKIDYLFVSDAVGVGEITVPETLQSDHRPYFAELEI